MKLYSTLARPLLFRLSPEVAPHDYFLTHPTRLAPAVPRPKNPIRSRSPHESLI